MNPNLKRLSDIANKKERIIIGLMSGTSLDGLDIALCRVMNSGTATRLELLHFETVAYNNEFKKEVQIVFAKKNIELEKLCLLHPWVALQHATAINGCLKKWGVESAEVDLLASHGQTIYHAPLRFHGQKKFGNATFQIGDGDHLAVATGIITISDFRQKHIAAGGEGAPLAIYGDQILFSKPGEDRIMLNIGGIANFTWLPGSTDQEEIFCTDTGPGNTLMDAFMQTHFPGTYYDQNAVFAKKGQPNQELLIALKDNDFFRAPFPKTTGPELFNLNYLKEARQRSSTMDIPEADTMATLNRFTAEMIASAIRECLSNKLPLRIFISGGGMNNPLLIHNLGDLLPGCSWYTTSDLGIDPGAKEAVLFAVLTNECICGDRSSRGKSKRGMPEVSMGKISFPS